jgi:CDP-diacylglycerol--glycerol-3-phosphate 3-phosphatidyltransferase
MTVYDVKPAFQWRLRSLMFVVMHTGATPNVITVIACALSIATGVLVAWRPDATWPLRVLPAALFVRMTLNALDGMMAREMRMVTPTGALLNELGDVLSDAAMYTPLALVPGVRPCLIVPIVILALVAEMAGVVAVRIGASRRYDGPMGKSDRAVALGAIALAMGLGVPAGRWIDGLLVLVLVLLVITIVNRARAASAEPVA